jgi:hypothetical protein
VIRIRAATELLDEDVRIAVRLPGDHEGADDLDDDTAVQRLTTIVTTPTNSACSVKPGGFSPASTRTTRTSSSRCGTVDQIPPSPRDNAAG